MMRVIFLALLLGLITGCSPANFAQYIVLGGLRVLTIVVDQPEVNPGTTVNFTPVLSDLNGGGRTLNYSIQGCIDPGIGIGAPDSCPTPDPSSIQSGTVTIAAGTSNTYTGAVSSFALTMPSAATIFASRSAADQYNGVAYLVFYTLSVPNSGTSVTSFVRVIISATSKTQKNLNPTLTSVDENDTAITGVFSMPTAVTNFSVLTPPSASETYQTMSPTGVLTTNTETLINTWFISDGSFAFERNIGSTENSWTPPGTKPTSRGLIIVVVTRDGRDGAVFQTIEMD